jgi:hypothetical protein
MLEVADACGEESDAVLIAAGNRVFVSNGAAWMGNGLDTRLTRVLNRITPSKWEKGIACEYTALHLFTCLHNKCPTCSPALAFARAVDVQSTGGHNTW